MYFLLELGKNKQREKWNEGKCKQIKVKHDEIDYSNQWGKLVHGV